MIYGGKYASYDEKYFALNFHDPGTVKKLTGLLSNKKPKVIIISGEAETGRTYLLESAIYQLREQEKIIYLPLDAADVEFITQNRFHQSKIYERFKLRDSSLTLEAFKELSGNILNWAISNRPITSLFMIALTFVMHCKGIGLAESILPDYADLALPERNHREFIHTIFDEITKKYKIIAAVNHALEFPKPELDILTDNAATNPRFIPVLIDTYYPGKKHYFMDIEPYTFTTEPLNQKQIKKKLNLLFKKNNFNKDFYTLLYDYTAGYPGPLGLKIKDLLDKDVITYEVNKQILHQDRLEKHISIFSTKIYDDLMALIRQKKPGTDEDLYPDAVKDYLMNFFHYAVLCGPVVPIGLLLGMLTKNGIEHREIYTIITNTFTADGPLHLFDENQETDRCFLGHKTLVFTSNLTRLIIHNHLNKTVDSSRAVRLLNYYENHNLPNGNRHIARMYYHIARYIEDDTQRKKNETNLWYHLADGEMIAEDIKKQIKHNKWTPEDLFNLINSHNTIWHPAKIRILLDTLSEYRLPNRLLINYKFLWAYNYEKLGEYNNAKIFYEELYEYYKNDLERSDALIIVNNLAGVYFDMRDYEKAKRYYEKVLSLREKIDGHEHFATVKAVSNLGSVFNLMGDYEKARGLYEEALTIRKKHLGNDHPDTITAVSNLASVYFNMNDYEEAKELYKQVFSLGKKIWGGEHINTIVSMNNLAGVYYNMGDYEKAKPLYDQTLTLVKEVLGEKHPRTLEIINNLILLNKKMQEKDKQG